jgi:hypothetical protein
MRSGRCGQFLHTGLVCHTSDTKSITASRPTVMEHREDLYKNLGAFFINSLFMRIKGAPAECPCGGRKPAGFSSNPCRGRKPYGFSSLCETCPFLKPVPLSGNQRAGRQSTAMRRLCAPCMARDV